MDKYNPDYRCVVKRVVPMVYTPIFNKVTKLGNGQPNIVEFNSGICLRKLKSILKQIESLSSDTLIYDKDKELLVTIVNDKNSIISQKLRENIELIQNMCNMDRNYRRKRLRTYRLKTALSQGLYDQIDLNPISDQCDNLEGDEELVELLAPVDISCQGIFNNDFSSQLKCFEKESMPDMELDNLISNTAELLSDNTHSSDLQQLCESTESDMKREHKSPIIKDVSLHDTVNSILADILKNNRNQPKEFSSVIVSTPNDYTGIELLGYKTRPTNQVCHVFNIDKQRSWIKGP